MTLVHRVLPPSPVESLGEHLARGGGKGLDAARRVEPLALIEELEASGLRGRGGAGFPTGRKWRTIVENRSVEEPATVVVNGAEGEPGTFKDRTILRLDPYSVLEGALIAARAVGADLVIFGLKESFVPEVSRLREALGEIEAAGWTEGVELRIFEGPAEYLYGEETALLETIDGRYPFPRIAPPFRRGVRELVQTEADVASGSGLSARVEMAGPGSDNLASPTLVDNVETLANVPRIVARGAAWFRTEGTEESPGTIVCTVSGCTRRSGVGEVMMGTPLREVIEEIGGGAGPERRITAVLPGVSAGLITEDLLDTPVSYEAMAAIGSGLGSAGFQVLDDAADVTAMVAGASRFLAIESCGQCTPCKQDGLALADLLARLSRSECDERGLAKIRDCVSTVADGARCFLASQQEALVTSLLDRFPGAVRDHVEGRAAPAEPELVAEMVDLSDGSVILDEDHRNKQPDWSYDQTRSGQAPADRFDDHRAHLSLDAPQA
ncbi:MAG: NADH-ubiquinone oxidoreductase-F iron-sulfur binding region domain-containing protein [Acidimicrobiales bacterium]